MAHNFASLKLLFESGFIMYTQNRTEDISRILSLADNMAAAAASFSSHGYDSFIQSRDSLKQYLDEIQTKYNIEKPTH